MRTDRSRSVASERYQNMTVPLCDGPAWTGANPQTEHNSLFGRACPWLVWAVETKTKVSVNPHPSLLLRAVADEAVHIYRRMSQVCYGAGGPRWIACTDRRCYCESAYNPKRKQNASSSKTTMTTTPSSCIHGLSNLFGRLPAHVDDRHY